MQLPLRPVLVLFPRGGRVWAALGNSDGLGSGSLLQVQSVGEPSSRAPCLLAWPCPASQDSGLFNLLLCDRLHTWWWGQQPPDRHSNKVPAPRCLARSRIVKVQNLILHLSFSVTQLPHLCNGMTILPLHTPF